MIAIVDTSGANLSSVTYAIDRLKRESIVTQDPEVIRRASHVILPGVGAAKSAMEQIVAADLLQVLRTLKQPTLGICLGQQLLFDHSEEGDVTCLGIIPGQIQQLKASKNMPVPHMGWNQVQDVTGPLYAGLQGSNYFYFVHSFVAPEGRWVSGCFEYGGRFAASVEKDNFFGVQFHPERSSTVGQQLLRNFLWL